MSAASIPSTGRLSGCAAFARAPAWATACGSLRADGRSRAKYCASVTISSRCCPTILRKEWRAGIASRSSARRPCRPATPGSDGWSMPTGARSTGCRCPPGATRRPFRASPPAAAARRALGSRLATGLAVFDTLLPIVRGQRIGLFGQRERRGRARRRDRRHGDDRRRGVLTGVRRLLTVFLGCGDRDHDRIEHVAAVETDTEGVVADGSADGDGDVPGDGVYPAASATSQLPTSSPDAFRRSGSGTMSVPLLP